MTSESIGPYRVLSRRLDGDVERVDAEAPDGRRVVLRRRGSGTRPRARVAEAAAFARADHPHVATLVDVLTGPSGDLVLAHDDVGGEPLTSWLAARGRPEPGEVVTLVVPVLGALQHLARRGVVISRVGVEDVEIDARGAPVLVGVTPGEAEPDAEGASVPAAAAFARSVVGHAAWPPTSGAPPHLDPTSFESLVESVFDLGEAVPLSSADAGDAGADLDPSGVVRAPVGAEARSMPAWLSLLPESEIVDRVALWASTVRARDVLAGLRLVRPRYRVLAACAVLLVGGVVAVGTTTAGEGDTVDAVTSAGPVPGPGRSTTPPDGSIPPHRIAPADGDDVPDSSGRRPPGEARTDDERARAVEGDDAHAAAEVLLAARLRCLREATPSCLGTVDQQGSPIGLQDAEVLDDPGRAAEAAVPLELTGEVSSSGGAALLSALGPDGRPASVLVMRTEAGWRLRDVFVGG